MQSQTEPDPANPALLSGRITRKDLAQALRVTVDTLGRWEARRVGPGRAALRARGAHGAVSAPRRAGLARRPGDAAAEGGGRSDMTGTPLTPPSTTPRASSLGDWRTDRLSEARAVIADIAHHSDPLIRLACNVLVAHGETPVEREEARVLLVVVDARRPVRRAQREDSGRDAQ